MALPSEVQAPITGNSGGNSATALTFSSGFTSAPTSGNIIKAIISLTPSGNASTITQTGVTWTRDNTYNSATSNITIEHWTGVVGAGAATTPSVTFSSGKGCGWFCEYAKTTSSSDTAFAQATSASSATADSGSTATTSKPVELWLTGHACTDGSSSAITLSYSSPTNGYSIVGSVTSGGGTGTVRSALGLCVTEKIVTSTGTAGSAVTVSSTSGNTTFAVSAVAGTFIGTDQPSGGTLLFMGV